MSLSKTSRPAIAAAIAFLALISLPYVLALLLTPPDRIFAGFLVNPLDGFSYLAKMHQGLQGNWLFELPYAAEAGEPALLFSFYLGLGHLARLLGANLIHVFHGVRLLAAGMMAFAGYRFLKVALPSPQARNWGFFLLMLGSGLGWLVAPFGGLTSDLTIPESIPFFASALNPHFPLSYACIALAAANALSPEPRMIKTSLNVGLGFLLGAIQPFAAVSMALVLGLWLGWETLRPDQGKRAILDTAGIYPTAGLALGAAPWIFYDLWLTQSHPVLALWNLQNQTPSPHPLAYLTGFGIPLLLAVIGILQKRDGSDRSWRLMLIWLVVNGLLLYAPFSLQRRFSMGLFLPIAALAGVGIERLIRRRHWPAYLLVGLSIPSNLFVLAAGLSLVAEGSPLLLLHEDERAAYRWISDRLEDDSLVLAAPRTGNRLPAYADVRVLYGHPFETPQAERKEAMVEELLRLAAESPSDAAFELRAMGVELLYLGPYERAIVGEAARWPSWPVLYSDGQVELLDVSEP
ncbi:MAG: hypothetical protein ACLFWD_01910 [Anaerolineales bacterium]